MLKLKKEVTIEEKKVQSLEKTIGKLETKNKNLVEEIEKFKADKNNNKNEKEKLGKELKILQRKFSKAKELKSTSTQTEQETVFQNPRDQHHLFQNTQKMFLV